MEQDDNNKEVALTTLWADHIDDEATQDEKIE
jgi:hypothetical protein